jgi:hypothetical protein
MRGLVYCINPSTRHNRLYRLTKVGEEYQAKLRGPGSLAPAERRLPRIPWELYSSVCYRHRSAVVSAIQGQMQAVEVKRRARLRDADLRMSANNVRDVMRYLEKNGIVDKLEPGRRGHPKYELTRLGKALQDLLIGAKVG